MQNIQPHQAHRENHATNLEIIRDLLAAFPALQTSDPRAALAAYVTAVEDLQPQFVGQAAKGLLNGTIKRAGNPSFAPSATELAIAARDAFHKHLDQQNRASRLSKAIEAPRDLIQRTPEEKARVDQLVAGLFRRNEELNGPRRAAPRMKSAEIERAQANANLEALARNPRKVNHVSDSLRKSLTEPKR